MSGKQVLLVEDDVDTRELTGLMLDYAGYEVIATHDLTSGLAVSRARPDIGVIMADMCLGCGQTGAALIRKIRRNGSHTPIILTSADLDASAAARELNVMFLPKPYGRQALLSAIAAASACPD